MNSKSKLYIIIIGVLIVLAVVLDSNAPERVDWRERYSISHTEPFDIDIFYKELQTYKNWHSFSNLDNTFYQYINSKNPDSIHRDNLYIYIGRDFDLDKESETALFQHISEGNDIIISVNSFQGAFFDSVGLSYGYDFLYKKDEVIITLNGTQDSFELDRINRISYIFAFNRKIPYLGLGFYIKNKSYIKQPNFVVIPHGSGRVFLHTHPVVFSNYFLLNISQSMAEKILSLSSKNHVVFFNQENIVEHSNQKSHQLQMIFDNPTLKWAWYISLSSLIAFIFFNAKRRQRIIPIIKPLENTTVGFTKTISNLLYESKDHRHVAQKRITYFLENIRNRYHISTSELNNNFIDTLSKKSGVEISIIEKIILEINLIQNQKIMTESQLTHLDRLLFDFNSEEKKFINTQKNYGAKQQ